MLTINLALVSEIEGHDQSDVSRVAAALQRQATRDFLPVLGRARHGRRAAEARGRPDRLLADDDRAGREGRGRNSPRPRRPAVRADRDVRQLVADREPRDARDARRPVRQSRRRRPLAQARARTRGVPGRGLRPLRGRGVRLHGQRHPGVRLLHPALLRPGVRHPGALQLHRRHHQAAPGPPRRLRLVARPRLEPLVAADCGPARARSSATSASSTSRSTRACAAGSTPAPTTPVSTAVSRRATRASSRRSPRARKPRRRRPRRRSRGASWSDA